MVEREVTVTFRTEQPVSYEFLRELRSTDPGMVGCQDGCTGFIKPVLGFKSDAYDAHNGIFSSIILGK